MRLIKNECPGGGGSITLSPRERDQGWTRCSYCGRDLKVRRGALGLVVDRAEHMLPRHSLNKPTKR